MSPYRLYTTAGVVCRQGASKKKMRPDAPYAP